MIKAVRGTRDLLPPETALWNFVEAAVRDATDAPGADDAAALGRLLYVIHLAVTLWWLLDKSARQTATQELIAMLEAMLPIAAPALELAPALGAARQVGVERRALRRRQRVVGERREELACVVTAHGRKRSSFALRSSRARCRRERTVLTGRSRASAISS